MPQAALIPIFTALGASAAVAAGLAVITQTLLINLALGALSKALAKRGGAGSEAGAPPINVTIRNTVEPRHLVFGKRRVGGVVAYYGASSSGGSTNDYLWYVIVVAGHQVAAITDHWLDTELIANSDINAGTGAVTSGKFAGKAWIWRHLGTGTQTVDTNVDGAFAEWTTNHRLRGCAYIVVRLQRDDSKFKGAPNSVTSLVSGALIYDPRQDSTNGGAGSQRKDDPSTWSATGNRNPALILRWYLTGGSVVNDQATRMVMYGLKEADSRIEESYFIAAANTCDEVLSGGNAPPSGSQTRYLCDGEFTCAETRREIINAILATFAGTLVNVHGKWRVYAGAYQTPIHTLTQDDLYGDLEVQDTTPHTERYNAVTATYVDASQGYIDATTKPRTDSSYEAQDGGEQILREIDLRAVTDPYQAQRLCEIELRKSRMQRAVKLTGALNLLKVAQYEGILFSHTRYGWTNRIFRCAERQFDFSADAGRVALTCVRDDPGVWTDMINPDYTTGTSATDVYQNDGPSSPTNLTASSRVGAIEFTIGLPSYFAPGSVIELWEYTSSTPFGSASKVGEFVGDKHVLLRPDVITRYYWVRIRQLNGALSGTYPASTGLAAAATVEADFGWHVDANGKPTGVRAVEGITDRSQLSLAGIGIRIDSSPDTAVAYGLPAIPISDASTYRLQIRHRSSASSASGLYLRMNERNSALPTGKTHIGDGTGESVSTTRTSWVDMVDNGPMPGTTAVESEYTYVPTSGTKFASLSFYNWAPATAGVSYEIEWVRLTRTGSNINLLPIGRPQTDTPGLVRNAATELYHDINDYAGSAYNTTTVRSFTVTPGADCDIEFTGVITADNVLGDSGNFLSWYVTPAGGSATFVAGCPSVSAAKQQFTFASSFTAVGGVTLTFELKAVVSGSSEHIWATEARVTIIKV